jgi:hypothetical protein
VKGVETKTEEDASAKALEKKEKTGAEKETFKNESYFY